ncbi:Protein required for ethanol metabolism [Ceratobasidium sp. 394]|nr:Protein required for ethanol metabolism [Ceratobasidium sp. 394]KAG9077372.1 Protein required for ethanol metabolism [Ceratobasidium sp. UAMH 11750]
MQAYTRFLTRRPFLGPCITTAALFAVGDIVAQQGVDRRGLADHDWVRTARLGTYGGAVFAPIVIKWCTTHVILGQTHPTNLNHPLRQVQGSSYPNLNLAQRRHAPWFGRVPGPLCRNAYPKAAMQLPRPPYPTPLAQIPPCLSVTARWPGKPTQTTRSIAVGAKTPATAHSIFCVWPWR